MIHTIENDYLRVSVDDHGAELCSIFDKVHNREVIWQADPAYWKRHAPVLFPNVGRHFEDHYRINGVEYPSSQHGFARDSEFTCVDMTADSITHRLKSSDATRENYPYDFELKIKHVLEKNQVSVCWEVISLNDETMYFTIGGHPAFNVPAGGIGSQEQYHLTFDGQDSLSYLLIDMSSGTAVADKAYTLELENGSCLMDFQALASGPSRVLLLYVLNHGWDAVMILDLRASFRKRNISTLWTRMKFLLHHMK